MNCRLSLVKIQCTQLWLLFFLRKVNGFSNQRSFQRLFPKIETPSTSTSTTPLRRSSTDNLYFQTEYRVRSIEYSNICPRKNPKEGLLPEGNLPHRPQPPPSTSTPLRFIYPAYLRLENGTFLMPFPHPIHLISCPSASHSFDSNSDFHSMLPPSWSITLLLQDSRVSATNRIWRLRLTSAPWKICAIVILELA